MQQPPSSQLPILLSFTLFLPLQAAWFIPSIHFPTFDFLRLKLPQIFLESPMPTFQSHLSNSKFQSVLGQLLLFLGFTLLHSTHSKCLIFAPLAFACFFGLKPNSSKSPFIHPFSCTFHSVLKESFILSRRFSCIYPPPPIQQALWFLALLPLRIQFILLLRFLSFP